MGGVEIGFSDEICLDCKQKMVVCPAPDATILLCPWCGKRREQISDSISLPQEETNVESALGPKYLSGGTDADK